MVKQNLKVVTVVPVLTTQKATGGMLKTELSQSKINPELPYTILFSQIHLNLGVKYITVHKPSKGT